MSDIEKDQAAREARKTHLYPAAKAAMEEARRAAQAASPDPAVLAEAMAAMKAARQRKRKGFEL